MKFTPSATPTHTLALPAELATAQFATHLKAGLELHGAEHLILYLRPCMKETQLSQNAISSLSSQHQKVLMMSYVATTAFLLSLA